jgi:predicted transposase/invertase (TIGR01784 family)
MASEVLITISKDEAERARLMSEYKYVRDFNSGVASAKRKGMEQGMKQGLKQGLEQGLQQGLQQGIQQGEHVKALEIAKNLKSLGVPTDVIAKSTKLSPEEVDSL